MHRIKLISWVAGLSLVGGAVTTAPASAEPVNHAGTATNLSSPAATYGFQPLINTPGLGSSIQRAINVIRLLTGGRQGLAGTSGALSQENLGSITSLTNDPNSTAGSRSGSAGGRFGRSGSANGTDGSADGTDGSAGSGDSSAGSRASRSGSANGTDGSADGTDGSAGSSADSADISADTRVALLALSERLRGIEQGLWAYGDALDQNIRDVATGLLRDLNQAEISCKAKPSECVRLSRLVKKINGLLQNLETLRTTLVKSGQKARIF